ncbi:response regulator [Psychroflexus sp. YR1-1]|uniref:Response regulator n=1 Tax=Psychroflexus aurantiacus TaxID=2709310 RepID=A0A6B3R187_9FLAO|nr:response regulator [Psychroflexus aurantiacus]NEV94002.1 response regulator [Psychroflexus aurantiacus]
MNKPYRYLLVDDDPTNNMICKLLILQQDQEAVVSHFENPETALEELKNTYNKPDEDLKTMLLLDINMPQMTGWEFLDEFETFEPRIKDQFIVYILTSAIQDFETEEKRYPFVSGFLNKPLKIETLKQILKKSTDA